MGMGVHRIQVDEKAGFVPERWSRRLQSGGGPILWSLNMAGHFVRTMPAAIGATASRPSHREIWRRADGYDRAPDRSETSCSDWLQYHI